MSALLRSKRPSVLVISSLRVWKASRSFRWAAHASAVGSCSGVRVVLVMLRLANSAEMSGEGCLYSGGGDGTGDRGGCAE